MVAAARRVIDHATPTVDWDVVQAGDEAYRTSGKAVPPEVVESLKRTRLGLKGPIGTPLAGYSSPNIELRNVMGLWFNLRMAIHFEGARSPHVGTQIVLIRDVTEDIVRGVQQMVGPDTGIHIKFITRATTDRLARFGLTYAREHGIDRVTVPNQAQTFRTTDGLFVSTVMRVAEEYPELKVEDESSTASLCTLRCAQRPTKCCCLRTSMEECYAGCARGWLGGGSHARCQP